MAPPTNANDTRRRSGEHRADTSEALPSSVFYNFLDEFRLFSHNLDSKVDEINKKLAEGSTRFALFEQKMTEAVKRSDDHSDQLNVLMTDKTQRDAVLSASAPNAALKQEIIRGVVLALVLGICAAVYNLWRDHEVEKEKTSSAKTTIAVPPAMIP